ncbi:hypothetical protein [Streptomyces peucetius]|uniref:Uncharacterized protein n=1 Tax=Streptomyces peucetius TaxID=1950 RepID=A0ABY6I0J7_STRPE|nr:hypothetical protein [Streptomyces peucetius]UYQ60496.1 hypothetical protein OGH68_02735 [Streptomyces peucetius]
MSGEKHAAGRAGHTCPVCGRAVPTTVERHKTLGVYVPVYREGPCDNKDCPGARAEKPPGPGEEEPVKDGGS